MPDSLTPRRFITASSTTNPSEMRDRVRRQRREGRDDVGDAGGHRDRDGQHVVDQQGAGRDQRGVAAEVGPADRVRAAAVRVGVAGLPVGGDDHDEQHDDGSGHPRGQVQQRQRRRGSSTEQDLLGRVRVGRQRVAAEDRQRQLLGQQRLARGCSLRRGRPTSSRFGIRNTIPSDGAGRDARRDLDAILMPATPLLIGRPRGDWPLARRGRRSTEAVPGRRSRHDRHRDPRLRPAADR